VRLVGQPPLALAQHDVFVLDQLSPRIVRPTPSMLPARGGIRAPRPRDRRRAVPSSREARLRP
jgi:hypothetical protein